MTETEARRLRVAIAGAGRMACQHARAISDLQESAELVAVADPDADARRNLLVTCPQAREFNSLEDLLAAEAPDVVHVCTPASTHEDVAKQALQAGCHVYVEKPFAQTATGAAALLRLAAERKKLVCPGHQLLFTQPARAALRHVPAAGSISHVESYFSFRPVRTSAGKHRLSAEEQLLDILPHPVYLLLHFLAEADPEGTTALTAVELGIGGTVHALLRRGEVTGTLVVTLLGRPIDNYLRVVGSNGTLHADFVRGTVVELFGPGTSGIDKLLNPYRHARQEVFRTTGSLLRRFLGRGGNYPGLAEILDAFYGAIRCGAAPPLPMQHIEETVRVCEEIAAVLSSPEARETASAGEAPTGRLILVTGGTGLLGNRVVRQLKDEGSEVRVIARRLPASWERVEGVDYRAADLGDGLAPDLLNGVCAVVHCAAETAGGWDAHEKNSIKATENVLHAAAAANAERVIHVSSLAALSRQASEPLSDTTPLETRRSYGPYIWGKAESERRATQLATELGVELCILRPGPLVDYTEFDPPGRLGKRVGNIFVAVGSPSDRLEVIDVSLASAIICSLLGTAEPWPGALNLIQPPPPKKSDLIERLRARNPQLRVLWMPRLVLWPLSQTAKGLQKLVRPSREPIDVARVFKTRQFDTTRIAVFVEDRLSISDGSTSMGESPPHRTD